MQVSRRFFLMAAPLAAAGCGGPEPVWAPDDLVRRVTYTHPGPTALTLYTMRNRSSGRGMHTGLMVSASQRVLWDPAGTFGGTNIAERNDVILGASPLIERYYISYHARETYYVQIQYVEVPPDVAELALQLVMNHGAVGKTRCAVTTGEILRQLPGFDYIKPGIWPNALSEQFAQYPGVQSRDYYENDSDDKSLARAAYEQTLIAPVTQ